MNSKRVFYLMAAMIGILVCAIVASAYLANTILSKKAASLNDLKLQSKVLEEKQLSLVKAKKDVQKYSTLEAIAKTIVPQDKDQALTVREIVKLADESGIKLSSINFPSSSLGNPGAARPATPAGGAAAPNLTQVEPVTGNPGLYVLPITISQGSATPVPYNQFIDFLSRLEQNRRTAHVSSIVLQPSSNNRNMLSFTLTLDQYIKP
jgi:hypothetical protein